MSTKNVGAATVITNKHGEILLVKHSYGKLNWELPGGKSESHESAKETAAREVMEETGLQVEIGELKGVYYELQYDMHHFCFLGHYDGVTVPLADGQEVTSCQFFSVDDLPRPISDFTLSRIRHAMNNKGAEFCVIEGRVWYE